MSIAVVDKLTQKIRIWKKGMPTRSSPMPTRTMGIRTMKLADAPDAVGHNPAPFGSAERGENKSCFNSKETIDLARMQRRTWLIVLGYLFVSAAWIFFSDRFLVFVIPDPAVRMEWSIYKGWVFISVTGLLLYLSLSRMLLLIAKGAINHSKTEEESRWRESLFKSVLENMPFEFWMQDIEGRCIAENSLMANRWGSHLGKRLDESNFDSGALGALIKNSKRAFKGEVVEEEIEFGLNGDTRYFRNILAPIRAAGGIRGVLGFNIDITEQKRAGKAIRESEAKYRNYIDGSPVAILVFDFNGRCMEVNPAACALSGKSAQELTQMNAVEILSPESVENARNHFDLFKKNGHASLDLEYMRKDGAIIYLALNAITLSENRCVAFCQDITERKTAHKALRASEQQYRMTIDSMKEAIHMVDEDLKILILNKTFHNWCEKLGLPPVSQGQPLKEAFHFLPEKVYEEYRRVFKTGTVVSTTERNLFDGKGIDTETIKIPIIENGRTVRVVTVIRDVTEEKKIESQFLRAQRTECIGTLASGVAHDLNNVLSPIMMGASMLHDNLPKELHDRLVSTIEEAAQRGADIVRQVLTFARGVEGERLLLQPGRLICDIEKIARETFPKSITITNKTPEDLWIIEGDTTQLHQVLLNLCVNARDAMPEGGSLALFAENCTVDDSYASMLPSAKPGRYVVFNVQDTGTGISRENQAKIFDPFFTTKKSGQGTGLGLSMVIGIAKSHDGFVTVKSEPGCGAKFKVFIPAAFTEANAGEVVFVEEHDLPRGNGELILLVDDEEGILLMAEAILTKHGYNVATARDGVDAISLYALHKDAIKLVITDIMMPFVDGIALVRALRSLDPKVRIITSTGQAEKTRQNELRAMGVGAFLLKPYNEKQLLNAAHQILLTEG